MNDQEKRSYLEKYQEAKKKGVPFFPDVVFKDAVVALIVFVLLIALAYFFGAPLEARADPADATYTPRPEWYFLFLFQLLKYFPGKLEVIGVVLVPTLAILALLFLPFLDRGPRRHFLNRPWVSLITGLGLLGVAGLTVLAVRETPPPAESAGGDQIARLYAENCAACHGQSIATTPGLDLHKIIAQGNHAGMPAWGGDIPIDQIDALVGYILSPGGSQLFTAQCGACHQVTDLVASNPLELKNALDLGPDYPPHAGVKIPDWSEVMDSAGRSRLLNFLVAPDGARLFTTNCSSCHGQSVAFSGSEAELRRIITGGGLHLDMPPWQEQLSPDEIDALARYVVDPEMYADNKSLFTAHCQSCHGNRIPDAGNVEAARQVIASGGPHLTMPVWGDILEPEAIDALVQYTLQAASGTTVSIGQDLFAANCAACHGFIGEGGPNPGLPGSYVPPIGTADFLATHDDTTLDTIISLGMPDFGMPPFAISSGGLLDDRDVASLVAYIRSWEDNPPVTAALAPSPDTGQGLSIGPDELYAAACAQCHGANGEGGLGPALNDPQFLSGSTDEDIYGAIALGRPATSMIAWGSILTPEQMRALVSVIRGFSAEAGAADVSFQDDVMPIIQRSCAACHRTLGGWDASSYSSFMSSGEHGPVVVPGDAADSLLVQKLEGDQSFGTIMPPSGSLPTAELQLIIDWITAGALDN